MTPNTTTWKLKEAERKLGEVMRRAREEGPQTITVVDDAAGPVAVSFTAEEPGKFEENLWEFFQKSPAAGIEFEVP
jgi:prevent-host-death family protein